MNILKSKSQPVKNKYIQDIKNDTRVELIVEIMDQQLMEHWEAALKRSMESWRIKEIKNVGIKIAFWKLFGPKLRNHGIEDTVEFGLEEMLYNACSEPFCKIFFRLDQTKPEYAAIEYLQEISSLPQPDYYTGQLFSKVIQASKAVPKIQRILDTNGYTNTFIKLHDHAYVIKFSIS